MPDKEVSKFAPAGVSGLKVYAGYVDEEWLPELKGAKWVKVCNEIVTNEPVVAAILMLMRLFVLKCKIYAVPSDKLRPSSVAAADFVESCFGDMRHSWSTLITEALTAVPVGWAYLEITHRVRNRVLGSKHNDNKIGWLEIALRAQDSLDHWGMLDDGTITGMYQRAAPDYRLRFVPSSKALHLRYAAIKNSPEGSGLIRSVYRPRFLKSKIEDLEAVGVERDLVGLPVMELPQELCSGTASAADKAVYATYVKLLKQIRRNAMDCAVIPCEQTDEGKPSGYKLRLLMGNSSRAIPTAAIIDRYDNRIATAMLASFILLGQQQHGSFALSSNMTDVFAQAVSGVVDWFCEEATQQAVGGLCELNAIAPEDCPSLGHGDIETPSLPEISAYVNALTQGGHLTPNPDLTRELEDFASLPHSGEDSKALG